MYNRLLKKKFPSTHILAAKKLSSLSKEHDNIQLTQSRIKFLSLMLQLNAIITTPSQYPFTVWKVSLEFTLNFESTRLTSFEHSLIDVSASSSPSLLQSSLNDLKSLSSVSYRYLQRERCCDQKPKQTKRYYHYEIQKKMFLSFCLIWDSRVNTALTLYFPTRTGLTALSYVKGHVQG